MATIIAGDIRSMAANNEEFGKFTYEQKSGGENKLDRGGLRANDDKAGITNAGNAIYTFNMSRGQVSVEVALTTDCEEYTNQTSQSLSDTTYTVTYRDSKVEKFKGRPVGDIEADKQAGTMTINFQLQPLSFS